MEFRGDCDHYVYDYECGKPENFADCYTCDRRKSCLKEFTENKENTNENKK